jgi:hypothetical protein
MDHAGAVRAVSGGAQDRGIGRDVRIEGLAKTVVGQRTIALDDRLISRSRQGAPGCSGDTNEPRASDEPPKGMLFCFHSGDTFSAKTREGGWVLFN